jgi:hypothetical protein
MPPSRQLPFLKASPAVSELSFTDLNFPHLLEYRICSSKIGVLDSFIHDIGNPKKEQLRQLLVSFGINDPTVAEIKAKYLKKSMTLSIDFDSNDFRAFFTSIYIAGFPIWLPPYAYQYRFIPNPQATPTAKSKNPSISLLLFPTHKPRNSFPNSGQNKYPSIHPFPVATISEPKSE